MELGLPGAVLFAGFLFAVFYRISRERDINAAAVMAGVAAIYLIIGMLSFGVWQNWWVATGWLVAGLMTASNRKTA